MGREARRRREQLKAKALAEMHDWTRPPTAEEALLVTEIDNLPTVTVRREIARRLSWAGMKAGDCHANCRWYEEHDPNGSFKAAAGWWKQPHGVHMLHSVIRAGDVYVCITPGPPPDEFKFAPDPEITYVGDDSGMRSLRRRGQNPPKLLRRDPARTIKAYTLIIDRINAGVDPMKAGEIDWSTL